MRMVGKELNKQETHKIVFAHIPSHPQNADKNMYMARNDSIYFNELIRKTQPLGVFFGHRHRGTSEYQVGRTRLITLRSSAWNSGVNKAPQGFMLVDVTHTGISTREILTSPMSAVSHSDRPTKTSTISTIPKPMRQPTSP